MATSDGSLRLPTIEDFLETSQKYEPLIPDVVVEHHLKKSGCVVNDPKLVRIIALAAQKFTCDMIREADTQWHASVGTDKKRKLDKEKTLSNQELIQSLVPLGITSAQPPYLQG